MIPKKLQIKNFLSYGPEPQTIDFLSYNLICLSGKNGHGKSALLDAITWVLWGQARKTTGTSKADEGLLHLGQKHMLVTFDFEINNTSYRVRREFVKTQSTPFSALDFGIVKPDGSFTTLTDKTIKTTQIKLEKTIGITFESFINSAFLRQGQANEFSKKSPKERKDILATILQLDRFENLKKVAIEKIKTLQQNLLQHQGINNRITQEISELKIALIEKNEHEKELKSIEKEEQILEQILKEDEEIKSSLLEQNKNYEIVQIQQKQYEQQLIETTERIIILEKDFQKIKLEQTSIANIHDLENEQKELRAIVTIHQEKLNKRLEIKDQYLTFQEKKQLLEKELESEKNLLTQEYEIKTKVLEEQIKQQEEIIKLGEKKSIEILQEISLQETIIAAHEKTITKQTAALEMYTFYEKQFEDHKSQYQSYTTRIALLEQQILDVTQKHSLSLNNQDPSCPLCEQNLSSSRKKFLEQKFQDTHEVHTKELENIKKETAILHKILIEEHATLQEYKKNNDAYTKLIVQVDGIKEHVQKLIKEVDLEKEYIFKMQLKLQELSKIITENKNHHKTYLLNPENQKKELIYKTLIQKIDVLKQTAQTLAYNKENHEKDFKRLQETELKLLACNKIQKEVAQQEQRRQQIIDLQTTHEKLEQTYKFFNEQVQMMKNLPHKITEHLKIEHEHKQQMQLIANKKSNLLNKKAILDLQSKKVMSLELEQMTIEKEIKSINSEVLDFTEISKALGKDGLQALLIEQALPEIEQQANILLAQLTDNQTQIFIESLRDLKKGGSKETLDIKISDAIGLRPYEMFSGGEAFRIDFALRIAISKLLARRAGTALQTLIIDEGFGSQDDDGLQLIMDSILKIQDNFAKIIIVSHLPSMKEQFPVQFLVQKKSSGSTITVIQQG